MLKKTVFLIAVLIAVRAWASDPRLARYTDDPNKVVWFLIISDTHVGEKVDGGDQDTVNLNWVLGEAYTHINPAVIFNTGDLVDATNGGLIPTGQHDEEWRTYQNILMDNNMTFDQYVDMPGNHDQYSDKGLKHFLKYSISGQYDGKTQHNVIRDYGFGKYQFITTATCGNDGAPWPADNASLDSGEIKFITDALKHDQDSSLTFVFGHHPLFWRSGVSHLLENPVKNGGKFLDLLKQYHVLVYFYGHTHKYYTQWKDGVLLYNLASLGKSPDKHFIIVAIDNNSLAVRAFKARDWPYIVTTAPADKAMDGDNPYARPVPLGWDRAVVRALVFDVNVVKGVKFSIDGGKDQPMYRKHGPVWQGRFDATKLKPGEHELTVKYLGRTHTTKFMVAETECSDGKDNDNDGLTDYPDDPDCYGPADPQEKGASLPDNEVPDQQSADEGTQSDGGMADEAVTDASGGEKDAGSVADESAGTDENTGDKGGKPAVDTQGSSDLGLGADAGRGDPNPRGDFAAEGHAGNGETETGPSPGNTAGGSCQCSQSNTAPPYGEFLLFLVMGIFLIAKRRSGRRE